MNPWIKVTELDPRLRRLFGGHYSATKLNPIRVSAGGGRSACLLHRPTALDAAALWVWSFQRFGHLAGLAYCMAFRRVAGERASDLALAAEDFIPPDLLPIRAVTFVNTTKIRSVNPGCCFRAAGWRIVGRAKNPRLVRLEKDLP